MIVLLTGILSWMILPVILAIIAWVMGNQALEEPSSTYSDTEMTLIKVGRFLGIANIVVIALSALLAFAFILFLGGTAFSLIKEGAKEIQTLVPLQ